MAKYKTIRVYPKGGVWMVKKDSADKASAVKNTKEEALRVARSFALNQGLTIIIHTKDGRIERTVTPKEAQSGDNCFITTACVRYYGLNDNCPQLQILREFRDEYLLKSLEDYPLVQQYYSIAPLLVERLESDANKAKLYEEIFREINSACQSVIQGNNPNARQIYINAVQYLIDYFQIK